MSMSKATSSDNSSMKRVTLDDKNLCEKCNSTKKTVENFFHCKHKFCIDCIRTFRINAYECYIDAWEIYRCETNQSEKNQCVINQCEIKNCQSKLPIGKCLKCNQDKPVDTLFHCKHKFCEDCIKCLLKTKTYNCPIKKCNAEEHTGMRLILCKYCFKYTLKIRQFSGCLHEFCFDCGENYLRGRIKCRVCAQNQRDNENIVAEKKNKMYKERLTTTKNNHKKK
ncbi:uncharacterized protein LOC126896735 isoform X2 [Daktulosphaira vitifoliae]|nr:uncharacterized protein LOC126896735 isoform X2 [Daktulosphaira vitifoliae]